uniref:Neprosin PEP catalytic domain-containing protein n=1 Tax=Brassica campestris TaxID=3711 RepID=M4DDE9_BRACM
MLKYHTIQMTPSSYPHEVLTDEDNAPSPSNDEEQPENISQSRQMAGECPENTIPIKRITKEDLLRVDNIKNYGKKSNISRPYQLYNPIDIISDNNDHEYAIAYVNGGPYRGTKAQITVWKPRIEAGESSLSQIWIIGGKFGPGLNTIEAGLHVNPDLYAKSNSVQVMHVRSLTMKSVVRCLLVVLTVMVTNIVEPIAGKVKNQQIELRLKQLNKQALKSLESSNGEIIDCISIVSQPAFDHPMLKNHTIQMTPSSYPHEVLTKENNAPTPSNDEEQPEITVQPWQLVGECPENTIPIKRITKEDLLREDNIKNHGNKSNISQPHQFYHPKDITNYSVHEYAIASVDGGPFRGTKAQINVWKPRVQEVGESSISQISIIGGKFDAGLNSIQAGSHVHPALYGDDNPHFFIYWTDPKTGNWWLQLNDQELIGYWPKEIFTNLADEGASVIEWGGEVVNKKKDGQHTTTEMGSGHFPSEGFGKASSFEVIKIIDMNNGLIDPVKVKTVVSRPACYDIKTGYDKTYEVFFYYGGPGRNPNCS